MPAGCGAAFCNQSPCEADCGGSTLPRGCLSLFACGASILLVACSAKKLGNMHEHGLSRLLVWLSQGLCPHAMITDDLRSCRCCLIHDCYPCPFCWLCKEPLARVASQYIHCCGQTRGQEPCGAEMWQQDLLPAGCGVDTGSCSPTRTRAMWGRDVATGPPWGRLWRLDSA